MDLIMNELIGQLVGQIIGALLAGLIAAVSVGGVIWKKLNKNEIQDRRMADLVKLVKSNEELLHVMACHQLQISCYRAVERGCITFDEKQEIKRLYDQYRAKNWNGPGEIAYQAMDKLPVSDSCN